MNTGWWEIDIHGCYSLVKIVFAPICACKNNRRIWRHNASISRSRDFTDQLWWRHNATAENTFLGNNDETNDRLRHSWKSLPNHLTRDQKLVIHGNSCIILDISTMGFPILVRWHLFIESAPWIWCRNAFCAKVLLIWNINLSLT